VNNILRVKVIVIVIFIFKSFGHWLKSVLDFGIGIGGGGGGVCDLGERLLGLQK